MNNVMNNAMNKSPTEFDRRAARLATRIRRARGRLDSARTWRLASGLGFVVALIACTAFPGIRGEPWAIGLFLATFPALVAISRRRASFLQKLEGLRAYYERQIARRRGHAPDLLPDGPTAPGEALPAPSALAVDLSLDGPRSLRAWLDETWTDGGRAVLRRRLAAGPPADATAARLAQKNVQDLSRERWALIRLGLLCARADARISTHELEKFARDPLVPPGARAWAGAAAALWAIAATTVVLGAYHQVPSGWGAVAWTGSILLTMSVLGKWGPVFLRAQGLATHLGTLSPLLARLETLGAERPAFARLTPLILQGRPARRLSALERALSWASVESNPILHFLVNALLPWSVAAGLWLESVRAGLGERLPGLLEELHEFEAWSSLGLYAAAHGGAWPEYRDEACLDFSALAHPLMARESAVGNDLRLGGDGGGGGDRLALLTGSNMSGKSTFLRTVGLNQVLANLGAPVRAAHYVCGMLAIESCIQISDSLADGVSYFYAEVLRLKEILHVSSQGRPTLALIDEIFRGTNNRERRAGSEAVIRALADRPTTLALVSTHDLELASLEGPCPGLVNWHFRDDVAFGRLTFDYLLKRGPCPTTNALRLMALEGLPVDAPGG